MSMWSDSGGPSSHAAPGRDARQVFSQFVSLLQDATQDRVVSDRLAMAGTTARLTLADSDQLTLAMLLDRKPIEVKEGNGDNVEVQIVMHGEDLARLFDEKYHLAMAIAKGEVTFRGPVRKLLRVMPILQHYAVMSGQHGDEGAKQRAAKIAEGRA